MCGIAGIVNFDKNPEKSQILGMLSQIKHRGPDQRGLYIDQNVSMGIQRLSIIDLSTGNQPIKNEDGSVAVIFNGEIYNFKELTDLLKRKGHIFKTKSDTEVLVHLYEVYGENMSKYLNGMFAFAIWDKSKKKIFISRDPVGIKPLYYYHRGNNLIFGSELKSILINPLIEKKINADALRNYSLFGYVPGNLSMFENIYKLPSGHNLIFNKDGKKIVNFFDVSSSKISSNLSIDKVLEEAVLSQSIADVPLGVLLSGGIDSSLVTYYLTKKLGQKIKTFSIAFKDKSFDESVFAKTVSRYFKTDHYQETFGSKDVINLFPQIIEKMDEPLADPSLFPTFKLCNLARKHVKVVLSGDGGDELFGGYPTYQGHIVAERFGKFIPKVLISIGLWLTNQSKVSFGNYPVSEIAKIFLKGFKENDFKRHIMWMSLHNLDNLLKTDLLKDNDILNSNPFKEYKKKIGNITKISTTKYQLLDFYTYLVDDLLVKIDRASMFNSLEVRVPFLDLKVISYAFNNDVNHVSLYRTKKVLRTILKGNLPSSIIDRKKKGFGMPLSRWLHDDLEEIAYEYLQNKNLHAYFNKEKISKIWEDHKLKKQNNSKLIWMLVMFSGWLDRWYK